MDTKQFLDTVLPTQGLRCICTPVNGRFEHYYGGTNEWAAESVERLLNKELDVYFGCSSFVNQGSRHQDNVAFTRSFWLDIDTQEGKPKEEYPDRRTAVLYLDAFCKEVGLPQPMLVSSGYGIHAYWPCDEDMTRAKWKETATLLKQATKTWGLAVDQSRTSDEASVLRPVGAANFKNDTRKEVRLIRKCETFTQTEIHVALYRYLRDNDALPNTPQKQVDNINSDLVIQKEYRPSSALRIAKHCAVIHEMMDKKGDIDQPTWYHSIGVLAFTEEGEEICHEWSSGHPDYSARETSSKVAQALKFAPTTCERLSDCRPAMCESCPHFGNIKSPIVLGIAEEEPQYIPDENGDVPDLPHKHLHTMPDGFGWGPLKDGDKVSCLWREIITKEQDPDTGVITWEKEKIEISDVLFYPTTRISEFNSLTDWGYKMNITLTDKKKAQRDFVLDTKLVAAGGVELISELGRREIVTDQNAAVQAYLKAWARKLRDDFNEVRQISQLGWYDKSFALGTRLISGNDEGKSLLTKGAPEVAKALHEKGSLDLWKHAMDKLYNVPGLEAQQFCVLVSFAAPLFGMMEQKGGITVYAGTGDSSFGKTTACKAGLTAWGNGMSDMVLNQFTPNALFEQLGVLKNLPLVGDEMTNCTNSFASDLVYSVSNGVGKLRLGADSALKTTASWSTIFLGNGNTLLSEKLAANRANAEGELMRLWEFIPRSKQKMPLDQFVKYTQLLKDNYGLAGPIYIKYVSDNYDIVLERLWSTHAKLTKYFDMQDKERYWALLFATIFVARDLVAELDLLQIDQVGLLKWVKNELKSARTTVTQSTADPAEQFGRMLSELQSGILVTSGRGNLAKSESARIISEPRGTASLIGRYIYPTDKNTREVLILSVSAARDWATKHGVPLKEIEAALTNGGVISAKPARIKLGQGVAKYAGTSTSVLCWELDAVKMNELLGDDLIGAKVKLTGQPVQPATVGESFFEKKSDGDGENEIDDLIST